MEKIESRARRMGFTMLEVVVVMGIIGILLTIMMSLTFFTLTQQTPHLTPEAWTIWPPPT